MIVFIDDILVYSKSEDEHMNHLRVVLQVFKEHQLFAKYSTWEFLLRSIAFHDHIISNEGIEVDPKKMKDIQSFLGLTRYYRRFVDRFASIVYLLTTFTQKNAKFEWSEACERSFQESKDNLELLVVKY